MQEQASGQLFADLLSVAEATIYTATYHYITLQK